MVDCVIWSQDGESRFVIHAAGRCDVPRAEGRHDGLLGLEEGGVDM